jgi:hypothetical protein
VMVDYSKWDNINLSSDEEDGACPSISHEFRNNVAHAAHMLGNMSDEDKGKLQKTHELFHLWLNEANEENCVNETEEMTEQNSSVTI